MYDEAPGFLPPMPSLALSCLDHVVHKQCNISVLAVSYQAVEEEERQEKEEEQEEEEEMEEEEEEEEEVRVTCQAIPTNNRQQCLVMPVPGQKCPVEPLPLITVSCTTLPLTDSNVMSSHSH